jgi:hypothetical protein
MDKVQKHICSNNFVLYIVKHSPHREMFQMKVTDRNEVL